MNWDLILRFAVDQLNHASGKTKYEIWNKHLYGENLGGFFEEICCTDFINRISFELPHCVLIQANKALYRLSSEGFEEV